METVKTEKIIKLSLGNVTIEGPDPTWKEDFEIEATEERCVFTISNKGSYYSLDIKLTDLKSLISLLIELNDIFHKSEEKTIQQ